MPKNGEQHIASLRDGRQIFIDGTLVEDHVDHPAFRAAIRSAAALYEYQAQPENIEKMTFVSPATGRAVNRMWQLPTTFAELVRRREALEAWANLSCGFLGRSPDHVASALSGMYMARELYLNHGKRYADSLAAYYEYARDNDLYLTYAIINPQADRSKSSVQPPAEQAGELFAAGVVDEDSEGVTLQGSKMLSTGCPMANEVMIACIQPLQPGDERYSLTAMVPLNAKGLKLLSRKSYESAALSRFDNPLSSVYDENDSILYLDT